MLHQYRVTKYDPLKRDEQGRFLEIEWTAFSDVGNTFAGQVLSEQVYYQVEEAYVSTALAFLKEAGIDKLSLTSLENHQKHREPGIDIRPGQIYGLKELETLFRLVLREKLWCKFEIPNRAYVHFGWDYYMYVGVPGECPASSAQAKKLGLFVEPMDSPYLKTD